MQEQEFELVRELFAKVNAQRMALEVIVSGLDGARPGLREKVVIALDKTAQTMCEDPDKREVAEELISLANLFK